MWPGLQTGPEGWQVGADYDLDASPLPPPTHRGTEEVFQALEDNQVALSSMKASRFVKAFEREVDHWECCLSLILEAVEMVLMVQRQWMYLEVRTHCPSGPRKPFPPLSLSAGLTHLPC